MGRSEDHDKDLTITSNGRVRIRWPTVPGSAADRELVPSMVDEGSFCVDGYKPEESQIKNM